jgi:hypothetical protein
MTIGICFLVNMLTTPSLSWWVIPAFAIGCGLLFDWADSRDRRARGRVAEPPPVRVGPLPTTAAEASVRQRAEQQAARFGAEHLQELRRLRAAVEDLHGRLSEPQRELLGDVSGPVSSLEERVLALVKQGRQVDAELRIHDEARIERELAEARRRVEEATAGAGRQEEEEALRVLEQQQESLRRVQGQRARIDARLRTAIGMLRALHLDLVECLSTDLEGSGSTLRRLGDQVREVSRSVDALAGAVDEVFLDELPRAEAPRRERSPRRGRSRDRS